MTMEAGMSVKRKRYSPQFKLDTVKANEQGDKSIAQWEREVELAKALLTPTSTADNFESESYF